MLRRKLSQTLIILLLFSQLSAGIAVAEPEPVADPPTQTEESVLEVPVADEPAPTTEGGTEPVAEAEAPPEAEPAVVLTAEPDIRDASIVVDVQDIDLAEPDIGDKYFVVQYEDGTTEVRTVTAPSSVGILSMDEAPPVIEDQMALYEEKSDVELVEPLVIRKISGSEAAVVPNDPYYMDDSLWGLEYINADDLYGWNYTQALSNVTIAIIDTGMDMDHPDLAASLASVNRGDGVMVSGYDAVNTDYSPDDGHGHGTHVAGTAAAVVNNGIGVAGVAGGAKILPIKVLADDGYGTSVDVAEGITWAVDHGADVISMSLGSSSQSQLELNAVDYAYSHGVIVVAATGNDSNNWTSGPADLYDVGDPVNHVAVSYPAGYSHVIGVGSVGQHGGQAILSDFSNSGSAVDVVAPGEEILSTYKNAQYVTMSGTSMATPHVSGLAALIIAENPDYSPVQVETALEGASHMVTSGTDATYGGNANYYGAGIVDAYAALTANVNNDVILSDLDLDSGSISFSSGTISYSMTVDDDVATIGVLPTASNAYQSIQVNGAAFNGDPYHDVALNVGSNTITITVTAKDTVTTGTYTVTVTRLAQSADLSAMTVSEGTLSPGFSASVTAYTATVDSAVTSLNVAAVRQDPHASLTINGDLYTSGDTKNMALAFGTNIITVAVSAHGIAKEYTITVTRPYYTDKTLSDLVISTGSLDQPFSADTTVYSASVGAGVSGLDITAAAHAYATIRINTVLCTSGVPFSVTLTGASTAFDIEVTAHNGDQQNYILTITRNDYTNANLSMIKIADVNLTGFAAGTLAYDYECDSEVAAPPVVAGTKAVTEASVVIHQATNFTDDKIATLVVTAADGTTQKTYTVEFNRYTVMDSGSQTVSLAGAAAADVVLLEIPETVTDPEVTVTIASDGTTITSTLPAITANRTVSGSTVAKMEVAGGTVVSAPAASAWDGTLALPTLRETSSVSPSSSTVNTVIELGYPGIPLTFSKAVRILIPGMGGKNVGYVSGGTFHAITTALGSDTQAAGDALAAGGDGKITVGSDLVVWTKHFTEFVAYTPIVVNAPSSGGGGGGGGPSGAEVVVKVNGESSMNTGTLTVTFSPNSYYSEFQASMNPVGYSYSPFKANQRLLDKVYILYKNTEGALEKSMTLAFAVNLKTAKLADERLALYYLDAKTNTWLELQGTQIDLVKGTVTGFSKLFTEYAVLAVKNDQPVPISVPEVPVAAKVGFSDLTGHWAAEKVAALVARKAIAGYPDGTFRPDAPITRAEFIAVLVKAQGMTGYKDMTFPDLEGHWAKEIIRIGYASGVVSGYADGLFRPDDPITREQMAVMVDRTLRYASDTAPLSMTDLAEISPWASAAIGRIVSFKVMNGYPDNTFRPQALATRAEAVAVILKTIEN